MDVSRGLRGHHAGLACAAGAAQCGGIARRYAPQVHCSRACLIPASGQCPTGPYLGHHVAASAASTQWTGVGVGSMAMEPRTDNPERRMQGLTRGWGLAEGSIFLSLPARVGKGLALRGTANSTRPTAPSHVKVPRLRALAWRRFHGWNLGRKVRAQACPLALGRRSRRWDVVF